MVRGAPESVQSGCRRRVVTHLLNPYFVVMVDIGAGMSDQRVAEFTASDLKAPGPILDAAVRGIVRIRRRAETFVLLREAELDALLAEAADPRPKTLGDLLQGYDAPEVTGRLRGWLEDRPAGKEGL